MKLSFVFLLFFLGITASFSQVHSPSPNATDKNTEIPTVAIKNISDKTTISEGNIVGMRIYNTATTPEVSPDYYKWDSAKWQRLNDDNNKFHENFSLTSTGEGAPTKHNPANPVVSDMYIDTITGTFYSYDGEKWIGPDKEVNEDEENKESPTKE